MFRSLSFIKRDKEKEYLSTNKAIKGREDVMKLNGCASEILHPFWSRRSGSGEILNGKEKRHMELYIQLKSLSQFVERS